MYQFWCFYNKVSDRHVFFCTNWLDYIGMYLFIHEITSPADSLKPPNTRLYPQFQNSVYCLLHLSRSYIESDATQWIWDENHSNSYRLYFKTQLEEGFFHYHFLTNTTDIDNMKKKIRLWKINAKAKVFWTVKNVF